MLNFYNEKYNDGSEFLVLKSLAYFTDADDEIPVIAPLVLPNGETVGVTAENNFFVLYPKRFGREIEINQAEEWIRLGRVVARMHLAGSRGAAPNRIFRRPSS